MSRFTFVVDFAETELDENNNLVQYYEENLPHNDQIIAEACKSWNEMHMEQYYDGCLDGKIESAAMKPYCREKGKCAVQILLELKAGYRLTEKVRNAIIDQTNAQLVDGWGESFFGYANIMTDGKKRFIVE